MNTQKLIKALVLANIVVACVVGPVCVADWIVDSPSDKVDAPDAENGKKVRILKDFAKIEKQLSEGNSADPGANADEEDDEEDNEPLREADQVPYGLTRLWSVPFLRIPMSKLLHNLNVSEFNSNISKIILELHDDFKRQFGPTLKKLDKKSGVGKKSCSDSPGELNNNFFQFQMDGGYEEYLAKLPEFKIFELAAIYMHDMFADYSETKTKPMSELYQQLVNNGEAEDLEEAYEILAIKPWATVQTQCSCHLEHDHPDAGLSGVYYARMPEHAGGIALHDPRNHWSEDAILHPKEGEFIMFPSWLRHNVLPTNGPPEDPRISIAWNAYGNWEQTDDVLVTDHFQIDSFLEEENVKSLHEFLTRSVEEE